MRTLPEKISEQIIDGKKICRDELGYLMEPSEWSPIVAETIAQEENITLGEDHWAVITFMRDYLDEYYIAADARFVFRHIAELNSESAKQGRERFFKLFPYGYTKQACKIAGMRQPRAWSTG